MADLRDWLAALGLEKFEPTFREHEIDFDVLRLLTDDDVKELGLPLGPRRKVLAALSALRAEIAPSPRDEAERRQLTVMFVDLADSTALAARLDPEAMREILRAYQNAISGEVTRVGGHVAKLMGDGVLAYFGWPRAHEDDAGRAARAGLAATEVVGRMTSPAGDKLACRVGIATGLVVVGDLIGEGSAREHAVVGATPNLAARLQAEAGDGQVLVSAATRRLLGDSFVTETVGERQLKGHAGTVPLFQVLREGPHQGSLAGGAPSPMIGREAELTALHNAWLRAKTVGGQAVLLLGEAGIGKSRLLRSLVDAIRAEHPVHEFLHCSPLRSNSPAWPIAQRVAIRAGIVAGDGDPEREAKLAGMIAQWAADRERAMTLLRPLLGLADSGDLPGTGQSQLRHRDIIEILTRQFVDAAGSGPALIIFEDIQWADRATLDVLRNLVGAIADAPILLVATARDNKEPGLHGTPNLLRLSLPRLDTSASAVLLAQTAGPQRLLPRVAEAILARSDGIPLFIEEIAKAVIEAPNTDSAVPMTLHDSLLARLDASSVMKTVAQIAACIGRDFEETLLQQIADLAPEALQDGLRRLQEAGLIVAEADGRYRFRHALICDAAYETLLIPRRKRLHERIARTLEAMPGDRAHSEPEVLARHWFGAGEDQRAEEYWLRARHRAAHWQDQFDALADFLETDALDTAQTDDIGSRRTLH